MHQASNRYRDLIETVRERNGKPVNSRVVYATIESLGIRDVDVKDDYGFHSIADLAAHIFRILNEPSSKRSKNRQELKEEQKERQILYLSEYTAVRRKLLVKDYGKGMFHLLPIVIQIAAIILFGFSLWTFVGFNSLQSTAVVLGLILGLTATGGFVQAMGKQVSFYWYYDDYEMTRQSINHILKGGLACLLFLFIVLAFINFILNLYPSLFLLIVCIYAFFIGSLLLVLAPLYTIKRRWIISLSVFAGTSVALILLFYTTWNIYIIHWTGIAITILMSSAYLKLFFKRVIKSKKAVHNGSPQSGVLLYRNYNYFLYGTLFYLFIFTDRILAWSSTQDRILPYIVYYDKDYEIGMDLAMLVFFLLAGVLEFSVSSFSRNLEYKQRTLLSTEISGFNEHIRRRYFKHLGIFALNALTIILLLYLAVTQPWGYQAGFDEKITKLSFTVAVYGGIGYLFLTLAILNILFLFTLSRSQEPLKALFIAWLVNMGVGWWFSRFLSFEYSVIGLVAGSLVLMVLTSRMVLSFFRKLDYNYYAAF